MGVLTRNEQPERLIEMIAVRSALIEVPFTFGEP
jgi:hypothetical protein